MPPLPAPTDRPIAAAASALLRLVGLRAPAAAEDEPRAAATSDEELREALWVALQADVPGFGYIKAVYQSEGRVVYCAFLEATGDHTYRRSFQATDAGVTLGEDAEEVRELTTYEVVGASGSDEDTTGPEAAPQPAEDEPAPRHSKGDPMKEKLIERLVTRHAALTEEDQKALGSLSEAALEAIAGKEEKAEADKGGDAAPQAAAPTPAPGTPEAPAQTPEGAIVLPREHYDEMVAAATAYRRHQENRRAQLVESLQGAQSEFSAEELASMDVEHLERFARLCEAKPAPEAPSFFGRVMPSTAPEGKRQAKAPPKPYAEALKRQAGTA